jgi:hypothetical protein
MAKITGKNTRAGSNKATGRDYSKESSYQSSPEKRKYRAELNAEARERGIYGKRSAMGKDLSHKKDGKMVLEDKSKNRSRQGSNGKSTKK